MQHYSMAQVHVLWLMSSPFFSVLLHVLLLSMEGNSNEIGGKKEKKDLDQRVLCTHIKLVPVVSHLPFLTKRGSASIVSLH